MENNQILTFLFGAGSAGTVVGSIMLWRIKKTLSYIDQIPGMMEKITDLKTSVDSFAGELKSLERNMYKNQTDIAVTARDLRTAFKKYDDLRDDIRDIKL